MDQLLRLGKRELICLLLFTCNYVVYVYLYVNVSGSITSVGEERANLSAVVYL